MYNLNFQIETYCGRTLTNFKNAMNNGIKQTLEL